MKLKITSAVVWLVFSGPAMSQVEDSLDNERLAKMLSLSEVVIRTGINVSRFIDQVKNDTTFYKAFRNLHLLSFTSWNDIRLKDKKGNIKASLLSRTRQVRNNGCRTMNVLDENSSGNFYKEDGSYNYFTAELYAGLFFTKGTVCGETNIVKGTDFNPRSVSGMEKSKQQLKMLFFNPGKKIPGIPFIGDKIDLFDPDHARFYDFLIDYDDYEGQPCYVFSIKVKKDLRSGEKNKVVIDSMITWFNSKTMEVMARNYDMSYDAGVYDFDVHMEVQMTKFGDYLVPKVLRYIGNWDVIFKKRERGFFTATLFDFAN
ncbi:MAG: hypothetical protein HZB42_04695 [Sphingobacteriales bacterium]|nr:hypothetical protein [Sphingobacteriales bacterium]